MFGTIKAIAAILFEKDRPNQKITVSLDDLCPLWIKFNNAFRAVEESPRQVQKAVLPEERIPASAEGEREVTLPAPPPVGRAHLLVQTFYSEVIEPCRESLLKNQMLEGINQVMDLLEKYGDCPSVAFAPVDSERSELARVRDILMNVTLREHSFHVTRIALGLLNNTYKDPVGYIPLTLIAGLGHDLGKIPALRKEGAHAKADHPRVSVAILERIFAGDVKSHWFSVVRKAVAEHHESTTDPFSTMLKEADGKARQLEIEQEERRVGLPWEQWFDVREFLSLAGTKVNVIQTGSLFHAFSMDGTVYCDPSFLYETAGILAMKKHILDIALLRDTDKDRALRKIVGTLRNAGAVTDELGEGYSTRRFAIEIEQGRTKKVPLVPLKAEAFPNQAQFEETKKTYPPIIKGVRAV